MVERSSQRDFDAPKSAKTNPLNSRGCGVFAGYSSRPKGEDSGTQIVIWTEGALLRCHRVVTAWNPRMTAHPNQQIYHRLENQFTQSKALAYQQKASGRILGRAPNYGVKLCVKAFIGPMPDGFHGIEFITSVPHDMPNSTPTRAYWYYPDTSGVGLVLLNDEDFARIPATVTRII